MRTFMKRKWSNMRVFDKSCVTFTTSPKKSENSSKSNASRTLGIHKMLVSSCKQKSRKQQSKQILYQSNIQNNRWICTCKYTMTIEWRTIERVCKNCYFLRVATVCIKFGFSMFTLNMHKLILINFEWFFQFISMNYHGLHGDSKSRLNTKKCL